MAKNEAKLQFKAETSEFDSAIKASNNEIASLRAELKLNEAQFRNSGDSAEYMSNKMDLLQSQLEANQNKQNALNSEIEVASRIYGEDSDEVRKLNDSLTYAQIQEENLKNSINNCNGELDNQQTSTSGAEQALQQMADVQASEFLQDISAKALEAAESIYELVNAASDTTDEIDKMSQRLGMSRDAYQEWEYVLSQSGVDITSMKTGFKTLTNTVGKCTSKAEFNKTAFKDLGMSLDDIKGKSQEDIFRTTVMALQNVDDQTKKATLAQKLFGRSGQEMIPLLNQSADSTEELIQKAHDLGLVMSDETIDAGVHMHDTIDTIQRSAERASTSLGVALMPVFEGMAVVVEPVTVVMQNMAKSVGDIVQKSPALQAVLVGVTTALISLSVALGIVALIKTVTTAFKILNTVLAMNPIVLVVAAVVGLVVALVYAYNNCETFRNIVNKAFAAVKKFVINAIKSIVSGVKTFVSAVKNIPKTVTTMKNGVVKKFNEVKTNVSKTVTTMKTKAVSTFNSMVTSIKTKVAKVKDAITKPFVNAWNKIKEIPGKIKRAFSNIKISIPKPKLPNIKVTWNSKTVLGKTIKWPSLSWASAIKKPVILTNASYIGSTYGVPNFAGEKGIKGGGEMVGGVNTVSGMITSAVMRGLATSGRNDDYLAEKIAESMSKMNLTMKIDRRTVGRMVGA